MRSTPAVRWLSASVSAVIILAIAAPAAAGHTPGDQPLPGYTIVNPPLAPAIVNGVPTQVWQGVHEHAAYIIEVPPQWNGDLAMWAHGYRGNGKELSPEPPAFGLRQKLLDEGYAWAASSYYDNGFDIRAGVLSTKALAGKFTQLAGRAGKTYLLGVSMGGYIAGRSVEQYPFFYDGALPMCGVLGDQTLLDFFLSYNLVAQSLTGEHAYPPPADYLSAVVPRMQVALGINAINPLAPEPTNDLGKQLRDITVELTGGPRPGSAASFAAWKNFLFTISVPTSTGTTPAETPGQLSTNVGTSYTPNAPVDVNALVQRVRAENWLQRILPTLTQVPQIFGTPHVPVLTLHGLGDMFVPFSMEQAYAADVAHHAKGRNVVQRAIRTANHCEFSPAEAGNAWDDLVQWVSHGTRPAGDAVASRVAVADPRFGCQFSDPAAYAAGTGTRRLYAAC
jgi:hypothetical protein